MNLKQISFLLLIPLVFLHFGCLSTTVTSANVTFPVVLGPVKNIGGQPGSSDKLPPFAGMFSAETNEVLSISSTDDGKTQRTTTEHIKEGTNKIDVEIMKVAAQGNVVKANNIQFGSYTMFLGAGIYSKVFTGIEGTVHNNTPQNTNKANSN